MSLADEIILQRRRNARTSLVVPIWNSKPSWIGSLLRTHGSESMATR